MKNLRSVLLIKTSGSTWTEPLIVIAILAILVFAITTRPEEKTLKQPLPTEREVLRIVSAGENVSYITRIQGDKKLALGDPVEVISQIEGFARTNNLIILSISPEMGDTSLGSVVTMGAFITHMKKAPAPPTL